MSHNLFSSTLVNTLDSKYISLNNLGKCYNNELSLLCLNIRSLPTNYNELCSILNMFEEKPTCIVLVETWLTSVSSKYISIPGYRDFHITRPNDNGHGGVSIYINDTLPSSTISNLNIVNDNIESITVSFSLYKQKFNVVGVYRKPSSNQTIFLKHLTDILGNVPGGKTFITGDLNIDAFSAFRGNPAAKLLNLMVSHGYSLCVNRATRPNFNNLNKSSILDYIFFNGNTNNSKCSIIEYLISDHYTLFFQHNIGDKHKVNVKSINKFRVFSENNLLNLRSNLNQVNWENVFADLNPEELCDKFLSLLYFYYDKSFPIQQKIIVKRSDSAPWFDYEIKYALKRKNILYDLYKKRYISEDLYKDYSKKVKKLINLKKIKFYTKKIENSNAKNKWSHLKGLLNINKKSKSNIESLHINNETITDSNVICNKLNEHFSSVGQKAASSIPKVNVDFSDYLTYRQQNNFKFFEITESEIIKAIKNIKSDNKYPLLEVPIYIYKRVLDIIKLPLKLIFNKCIREGIFPSALKKSKIVPLYKNGSRTLLTNYRPISLLPLLSKIFEKIIHYKLVNFLNKYNIINKNQFGFCKGKSTTHALHNMLNPIYEALNNKNIAIAVFLDLSKAFDSINHNILLKKLEHYGIRNKELSFFKSYLSDRFQYVCCNDTCSNLLPMSMGVPQGSVLGPLLFIIFINDFFNCHYLDTTLFADDSTITTSAKTAFEAIIKTNVNLTLIHKWLCCNFLLLNINKSQYIIFSNKNKIYHSPVKLDNISIQKATCVKVLGVEVDEKLNFSKHVSKTCSKLAYCGFILSQLKSSVPLYILKMIYYAFASPLIEYGISVWGSTFKTTIAPLQVVQNNLIRSMWYKSIKNNPNLYKNTSNIYKEFSVLNVESLYKLNVSSLIYMVINDLAPDSFKNIIPKYRECISYNFRRNILDRPQYTISISSRSIAWRGPSIFNSIPDDIIKCSTLKKFRQLLKQRYISNIK